eukprot:79518_1
MAHLSKVSSFLQYRELLSISKRCLVSSTSSSSPISNLEPNTSLPYNKLMANLSIVRKKLNRPLSLAEKILYSHLDDPESVSSIKRGDSHLVLRPDRIATHDASGPMALLQFISSGIKQTAIPTALHCDHIIRAHSGAAHDLNISGQEHKELHTFLASACKKYGVGFWKPGSGIIHQIILENYAFPGGLMIATDSHSPNAGGLSMCAIGVGISEVVESMAGLAWELKAPKLIGIELIGALNAWCSPKDVILSVTNLLTVSGGTNCIVEYFGDGVDTISCTGMATICNMGAEIGATCSVFGYTSSMREYLIATNREYIANHAEDIKDEYLTADRAFTDYDHVIRIDLSQLQPALNGPFTPDARNTAGEQMKDAVQNNGWPQQLSAALIGSCTNSSYEDMSRVASLVEQAKAAGLRTKIPLLVSPGSEQVRATMQRDGIQHVLESVGATILSNSCGPCIGQWQRDTSETPNSIVTSFNRNFAKRNDGNPLTNNFLASPEMCTALAFAGCLTFDPQTDDIDGFKFEAPSGNVLPPNGFDPVLWMESYQHPAEDGDTVQIEIDPESDRIALVDEFQFEWNGKDMDDAIVLIKARGKCTTDHISMAGPWLKYRGHLDILSNNTLIGVINDANGKENCVENALTGEETSVPEVARYYKEKRKDWIVIGGTNYGEGSSREHAALSPRYLGGKAVIAKSFARIHETNLKKQGMLALTFENEEDFDKIQTGDTVSVKGLKTFAVGSKLHATIKKPNGDVLRPVALNHSFNEKQIEWFKAGSSLNVMKQSNCTFEN